MAQSKYHCRFAIEVVESNVSAPTKFDGPFPERNVHILNGTTNPRLLTQNPDTFADSLNRTTGGVCVF